MEALTIRRIDAAVKRKLRVRAAQNGRSMEEEAREILKAALNSAGPQSNLADEIRRRIAPLRGVDVAVVMREPLREPPRFDR